jgi:hypothetical protein
MNAMDKILILITCVLTLMTNTPYHSFTWAFFGMASCLITGLYTWLYSEVPTYRYPISGCCFLLFLGICKIIYDSRIKEQRKQRLSFKMRDGLYYEYCYQILFGGASKA